MCKTFIAKFPCVNMETSETLAFQSLAPTFLYIQSFALVVLINLHLLLYYSCLCMKISSFLYARACAMPSFVVLRSIQKNSSNIVIEGVGPKIVVGSGDNFWGRLHYLFIFIHIWSRLHIWVWGPFIFQIWLNLTF